jgi:methylthioribose-1-phosphate isomerase
MRWAFDAAWMVDIVITGADRVTKPVMQLIKLELTSKPGSKDNNIPFYVAFLPQPLTGLSQMELRKYQ